MGVYTVALAALAYSVGRWREHGWHQAAAVFSLAGWLALACWHGYDSARQHMSGFSYLVFGGAFFVVAAAISLSKATGARRLRPAAADACRRLVGRWSRAEPRPDIPAQPVAPEPFQTLLIAAPALSGLRRGPR